MGEGDQKVQTSSYKINKSWKCNVQHGDYRYHIDTIYCIKHLKVAGTSWWSSGKESTLQRRGRGFDSWSGN